jgi:hypothetical protein
VLVSNPELFELSDLLEEDCVRPVILRDAAGRGPAEHDVPMVMSYIEDRDPQVVALILEIDVVAQGAVSDAPDLLVEAEPDKSGENDPEQQAGHRGNSDPPGSGAEPREQAHVLPCERRATENISRVTLRHCSLSVSPWFC